MGKPQRSGRVKRRKMTTKRFACHKRTKDMDEIHDDLKSENVPKLISQVDQELPGLGKFYCVACARHFISDSHLQSHFKSKPHKKRLSALKDDPYSSLESQMAGGMAPPDNGTSSRATLPIATPIPSSLDPAVLRSQM
ncbi:hypothetical protein GEMRC1_004713 [Eukaryota sp. GEM-RC1]